MSYYYKASEELAKQFFELLEELDKYSETVFEWHLNNFDVDEENDGIYIFKDVPIFSNEVIRKNPELKPLLRANNNFISKGKKEGKELIKNWLDFKKERGYEPEVSYTRDEYALFLRCHFRTGAVTPLVDKEEKELYLKTDIAKSEMDNTFEEITLKDFNVKEVKIYEKIKNK